MNKMLRFFLITVAFIIAAVLVLAIVEPTDVLVTRSLLIKAPKDSVFAQMVQFKNWPNWSPWYRLDTNVKMAYFGTDGQPGSGYRWTGDDNKTGEGEMKNTGVEGTKMNFELTVIKPHSGNAKGSLIAQDTAGMTKATWNFVMHMPFPLNAMNVFMNMDKMLGGDFENGLNYMKQYEENHVKPAPQIQVTEVDYPAHIFEGYRKTISWSGFQQFFNESYGIVAKDAENKINGRQVGIFYTWDTVNKQTDAFAGFPVSDSSNPQKGVVFVNAGPTKAAMAVEKGGYGKSADYHNALAAFLRAKGLTPTLVMEEYVTGPKQETDSSKWVTNIYYLEQ